MSAEVKTFSNRNEFWNYVANFVRQKLDMHKGTFRIATSGGSAAEIFDVLSVSGQTFDRLQVNWELWQTDERFISPDSPDSNQKLLRKKIGNVPFHPFKILETPEESAREYATQLHEDSDGFFFDLVILGVGPDGHTASLFPHSPALETHALTAHTTTDHFTVPDRLTLTFPAIQKSRDILVLMMGANKKEIFEKITNPQNDFYEYPTRKLLDMPQALFFFSE